ncbi:MAG: YtxH domain-containing protein [Candidatus Cryptobacteroides sp.]
MKHESLFTLVAGLAIGVTAGILLAPEKGSETRRKIKEAAHEGCDLAKEKGEKLKEELNELKEMLAKESGHIKADVKDKFVEKLEKLEKALAAEKEEVDDQTAEA